MIHEYWPEMFEMGLIYRFQTPIVKAFLKKETLNFFSEQVFEEWRKENEGKVSFTSKRYKGLGTNTPKEFREYFQHIENHLIPITYENEEDFEVLDLAFNHARADDRKNWLSLRAGEDPDAVLKNH